MEGSTKVNPVIESKLMKLYLSGDFSHDQVSYILNIKKGICYQFYWKYKKIHSFPRTRREIKSKIRKYVYEAYEMYKGGKTLKEVGKEFGVTRERIRQVFKLNGLNSRPLGRVRIYFHCEAGHELKEGENRNTCSVCREAAKERKLFGLNLRTHCIHGHEYTLENTRFETVGRFIIRRCKTCQNTYMRKYLNKLKEKKMELSVQHQPINELSKLPEHLNEAQLILVIRKMQSRIDALDLRVCELEGKPSKAKVKKELTRIGNFEPYVNEVLANGRSWSTYSMCEEIRDRHPNIPAFKPLGVQNACTRLYHAGKIEKVANCTYRKKP